MSEVPDYPGAGNCSQINWEAVSLLYGFGAYSATVYGYSVANLTAAACLFGILSVLAAMSTFFLTRKGIALRSVQILLSATIVLFASTSVNFGYTVHAHSMINQAALEAGFALQSPSDTSFLENSNRISSMIVSQSGAMTATLALNMILSDIIVWWRALLIWPGNRLVLVAGVTLLFTTGALGIVTAYQNFPQGYASLPSSALSSPVPKVIAYEAVGLACIALSLFTNAVATGLIGYKAWEHSLTMQHVQVLGRKTTQSRALSTLIFIVESGICYCVLWAIIVSYSAITVEPQDWLTNGDQNFINFMNNFVFGCLVTLVAIYPMAIIVIVAVNQSPIDHLKASLHRN